MHFPLPTFVPGPVATVIALLLLAYYVASPPLLRWSHERKHRHCADQGRCGHQYPGRVVSQFRRLCWFLFAEVLLVMAFLGTATAVSPADIGWAPLALADPEPLGLLLTGAGGLTAFVLLLVSLASSHVRFVSWARSGQLPPEVRREFLEASPRNRREIGLVVASGPLSLLSQVLLVYTVLFPVLAQATGSALLAALVLGLLGGWQHVGQGGNSMWVQGAMSTAGLLVYGLLFPGSLLVPVLLWSGYWVIALSTAVVLASRPLPESVRPLHPVEVTMLDADGNPVERPGQGALDR